MTDPTPAVSGRRRPVRTAAVVLLAVLMSLVVAVGVVAAGTAVLLYCASPPSEQDWVARQAFVQAHLAEATDFERTVLDCDDRGQAFLDFRTSLSMAEAEAAFLADPACSRTGPPEDGIRCPNPRRSLDDAIYVYFDDEDGTTSGSASIP